MIPNERRILAISWITFLFVLISGVLLHFMRFPGTRHYLLAVIPLLIQIPLLVFLSLIIRLEVYQDPKWKPWCRLAKVGLIAAFLTAILAVLIFQIQEALEFFRANPAG